MNYILDNLDYHPKQLVIKCRETFFITESNSLEIDCPNEHGGIGKISFDLVDGMSHAIWTGDCHIEVPYGTRISIDFGNITKIYGTDDFCDDECPDKTVFELDGEIPFDYNTWYILAKILLRMKGK